MPRARMQFAITALLAVASLVPLLAAGAHAEECPERGTTPAVAAGPGLTDALWRLAAGREVMAPYDPATFVGPPVPLAILYAPASAPAASAGLRIEIEAPLAPAGPPAPAPPGEPVTRWADVFSRVRPVYRPDGSVFLDLSGITLVDLGAWRDADGLHLYEGDRHPETARGDR